MAGNHQACFWQTQIPRIPGFPRRSPGWNPSTFGQDMIKDLATKTSKVSKMSKKCEKKKVKRGRLRRSEVPQGIFFCLLVFLSLSCTCRQENLGPTKNHVQIRRVGSPLYSCRDVLFVCCFSCRVVFFLPVFCDFHHVSD